MAAATADLLGIYKSLLKEFGPQHWWPAHRNFMPKEWEVCAGAILTQNTNWKNAERALDNLDMNKITSPESVIRADAKRLEEILRPSGFYKQKAERLKTFAKFVLGFGSFDKFRKSVERSELLKVRGIGPETCDSILLYACGRPHFVIDSYTRKFVKTLGVPGTGTKMDLDYEGLRAYFEKSLPKDISLYKEFHALIVEWGKSKGKRIGKANGKSGQKEEHKT